MEKFWIVYGIKNTGHFTRYDSYAKAEEQAKRIAFTDLDNKYTIMEAVASTKRPVPEIDIIKL